ncbi:hypothetical protein EHS25_009876 [Saitozyma podzolica]|uniref:Cupin type-1 domain-containing protein n=1 Tax=Saitozyma podzolica TaxID=1890683 RepID=A0A427YKJ0_9TREE|nr:hypothetical protein EHS25_009876 [Saitozyma podzolica]
MFKYAPRALTHCESTEAVPFRRVTTRGGLGRAVCVSRDRSPGEPTIPSNPRWRFYPAKAAKAAKDPPHDPILLWCSAPQRTVSAVFGGRVQTSDDVSPPVPDHRYINRVEDPLPLIIKSTRPVYNPYQDKSYHSLEAHPLHPSLTRTTQPDPTQPNPTHPRHHVPSLASTFTFGLLLSLAGQSLAAPTPASDVDEAASLAKRQNAPAFGGWDQGENVTALIQELSEQVNPIDRDVLLPRTALSLTSLAKNFGGGGKDGGVILADNTIFPGVVGNGLSWLVGFLGPCGMVAPHNHPRATEYLMNIAGPLSPLDRRAPLGSVHYVSNEGCDPALIAAAFNSETPGVGFLSSMYTAFDPETIDAAFGNAGATIFNTTDIPGAVNLGHQSCLQRCGINGDTFNINGKISNPDLMNMAFAGYLKSQGFNYDGYNASTFQQYN